MPNHAVTVANLLLAGHTARQIREATCGDTRLAAFIDQHGAEISRTAAMLASVDHSDHVDAGSIASRFDSAVRISAEASVALFSLGSPELLAAMTEEIVGWLRAADLISSACDVLDLGCGIGRLSGALLPLVRSVVGADVSFGMLAEARRRVLMAALVQTDGVRLPFAAGSFDTVLAVDSFPYLFQAGGDVARGNVAESARVLRCCGRLVIMNVSYGNADEDAARLNGWAAECGLHPHHVNETPFTLWDGAVFTFERSG